jgi:ferredoxin
LKVTYSCIVYQEQVIEIFRQLGGYTMGQADNIRRAISKKKQKIIEAERKVFVYGDEAQGIPGCIAKGVSEAVAQSIYDEIVELNKKDLLLEKCANCKSKKHVAYDELLGEEGEVIDSNRFDEVERIERMSADERFEFWQNELSKCIRCNACRDACPACTCEKCVFDNPNSGVEVKSPANSFEEKLFHIIRAFHVAGRCTDCGECSRACPQNIPLHLLNRKFIKDINHFYGAYQAGSEVGQRGSLVNYSTDDVEPCDVFNKGDNNNA